MSSFITSFACGTCGSHGSGRATPAFLESIGWRQVDGAWVCSFCTGLFAKQIEDKPDVIRWLLEKSGELPPEEEP